MNGTWGVDELDIGLLLLIPLIVYIIIACLDVGEDD